MIIIELSKNTRRLNFLDSGPVLLYTKGSLLRHARGMPCSFMGHWFNYRREEHSEMSPITYSYFWSIIPNFLLLLLTLCSGKETVTAFTVQDQNRTPVSSYRNFLEGTLQLCLSLSPLPGPPQMELVKIYTFLLAWGYHPNLDSWFLPRTISSSNK